jgi:hypothetical protein
LRVGAAQAALALTLLAGSGSGASAEPVRVVEVRTIDAPRLVDAASGNLELKLYVHTFSGSRWTAGEIEEAVIGSARLLAQCGISLTTAELRVLDAPQAYRFFDTPVSRELLRHLDTPRPAVFFVEDTHNDPAFDAEAVGVANARRRPELVNTVWVAHGARDLPYALAHELVHVLTDSGAHTRDPGNLMRDETAPGNSRLDPAQCERMRSRGEANGLLRSTKRRATVRP